LKLTVVSSLASGADQIVARVVCGLVRDPERRNRYVEAVLPFAPDVYEQTFATEAELVAFRAFLKLDCGQHNTHPEPTVLFPDRLDPRDPTSFVTPAHAYGAAGRYVVDASELVVAIWDPARTPNPGGTEDTVRYAIDRGRVVLWLNPSSLWAGAFLLRRTDQADAEGESPRAGRSNLVPAGMRAEPVPSRAKDLSPNFHRLAAYNRDSALDHVEFATEWQAQSKTLREVARACGLPEPVTGTMAAALLPHIVRADHLSIRYRSLRGFSAKVWPTTSAIVVSLMAFQIIFFPSLYWLAAIELVVLMLGYLSYRVSIFDAWHEKWLHDRRLAEGLRGAMFVALVRSEDDAFERDRLASAARSVATVRDPLPFYNPASEWFVSTVKRVLAKERRHFAALLPLDDVRIRGAVVEFVKRAWILDQADYHERKAESRRVAIRRTQRLQLSIVGALVVIAGLHAVGVGHGHESAASLTRIDQWIGFATVALPAWAAAVHVMSSLDDHKRLAERSTLMASLLRGLADRLEGVGGVSELHEAVTEAERILDLVSAEWAESLMDRRPEFTG
jgi:hypothetical protein